MSESPGKEVPYVQPLLDAVGLFEELGIGYALIGGVAAMYYGRARFTEELALSGHMEVLAGHPEAMRNHHFDPTCTYKLYHDGGVEVDLWKDEHSDEIVARAVEVELAGRKVRIAEVHDLIAMKLRAGRMQDDYDISEIVRELPVNDAIVQSRVNATEFARFQEIRERIK